MPILLSRSLGCDSGTMRHSLHGRDLWLLGREPSDCYTGGSRDKGVSGCMDGDSAHDGRLGLVVVVCGG